MDISERDKGIKRIGVHTSISGGVHLSLERAKRLGCNTVQIFSHSPRSWSLKRIKEEDIYEFKRLRSLYDIWPVYIHTSYLINLASPRREVAEKSMELLVAEMEIADLLGADYVVLHPGSASDSEQGGFIRAVNNLRTALKKKYRARLLLENTAGERGDLTWTIGQLAEILKGLDSESIGGICLDTCHAFQAGYDLSSNKGVSILISRIKDEIGIERLKLIHLNDSKKTFNNRVDRHEHIGKGTIGERGFKALLNDNATVNIPIILETPKDNDEDDIRNLKAVKRLINLT